jgi:hypothetical protein
MKKSSSKKKHRSAGKKGQKRKSNTREEGISVGDMNLTNW